MSNILSKWKARCLDCNEEIEFIQHAYPEINEEEYGRVLMWIARDHSGHRITVEQIVEVKRVD